MTTSNSQHPDLHRRRASGTVEKIDLINRELSVLVDGQLTQFYVPTACPVFLRGERIKLRLVRCHDRVRVKHSARGDCIVADAIEVQFSE
jgi:hypothetical protein